MFATETIMVSSTSIVINWRLFSYQRTWSAPVGAETSCWITGWRGRAGVARRKLTFGTPHGAIRSVHCVTLGEARRVLWSPVAQMLPTRGEEVIGNAV
jgi:hypothetical protein